MSNRRRLSEDFIHSTRPQPQDHKPKEPRKPTKRDMKFLQYVLNNPEDYNGMREAFYEYLSNDKHGQQPLTESTKAVYDVALRWSWEYTLDMAQKVRK